MWIVLLMLLAFVGGCGCVFVAFDARRKQLRAKEERLSNEAIRIESETASIRAIEKKLSEDSTAFTSMREQFEKEVISYQELCDENGLLKQDLRNVAVGMRKLELDRDLQTKSQADIDLKVKELGGRYLRENVKWIGNSLTPNNFASCKQKLLDVIERCRGIGLPINQIDQNSLVSDLKTEFERVVRAAIEREEQARIKAQIREEQLREREVQREQERIAREQAMLQAALAKALADTHGLHSAEIESLKARLAEAEAKQRAISQAQLTKAGFVYVISNIGSFGEGVYKIGMTRRLEPLDRVKELGDASVPFPFDVHMMISCEDAPSLENALHRKLLKQQVNKTNPRKEFFKADIYSIVETVRAHHGEVEYVADAEALQYRQSLTMSDDDQLFIEHVFDDLESDELQMSEEPSIPVPLVE